MYKLEDVTTKEQLETIRKNEALTFEGTKTDKDNMEFLINWLKENGAEPKDDLDIYVIKGSLMNESYSLTGDNTYPDDLSIVCVPLSEMEKPMAIAIPRFQLGGRWISDVIDNNLRREEEN